MSKEFKASCGCSVKVGKIVTMCPGAIAGFQLAELSKKVEGDGKMWADLIMKSLSEHAKSVINESKKEKGKIITLGAD